MNVPQTQSTLARSLDVASMVALQVQAAEQAQRQQALSGLREADHAAASVAQAQGAAESAKVGERPGGTEEEDRRTGKRRSTNSDRDAGPLRDAPNPGPLGHRLDIIA